MSKSFNFLPSTQELCVGISLYKEYDISQCNPEEIIKFAEGRENLDAYCLECEQFSVFQKTVKPGGIPATPRPGTLSPVISADQRAFYDRDVSLIFTCSRNREHSMKFYFRIKDKTVIKIGQYPSLADLHQQNIAQYRKILSKQEYGELARGIGLYAHGIGIGSFVYLRRIFERLVESAHEKAKQSTGWNEDEYRVSRMPDKISLLKTYLPENLVHNASIYSILSKGIHSLSEDECLKYFETLRFSIELILDEEIELREKERKAKGLAQEVERIKQELG